MNITVGELIAFLQPLKPETEIRNLQFEITVSVDTLRKKESTPVATTQICSERPGVPMDPGEGYRLLERGERFRPYDEVYRDTAWLAATEWGTIADGLVGEPCDGLTGRARRKLDPVATPE